MTSPVHFSRQSDEWSTPQDYWLALDDEFRFDVDAAATAHNTKCGVWFGMDYVPGAAPIDALAVSWREYGRVFWCNPPYSKVGKFVAKAAAEARKGCTVVLLIPARPDTRYWADHIWDHQQHKPRPGVEVRFLKGRLKFGNAKHSAPFPSAVVIMRPPEAKTEAA